MESVTHEGVSAPNADRNFRIRAHDALRTLAAISSAGALSGLLVGGVGGRLTMMLLARLNPEASGIRSDDGFIIGRFTFGNTLNLLAVGFALGLFGAAIYVLVRGLLIGPRWFQILSISVGPALVVGNLLVHTDGVDFTRIDPAVLAIALFVLLPGVYAVMLTVLAERWAGPDGWFRRSPMKQVAPTLLVWVLGFPLLPVLAVLVALWLARTALHRNPNTAASLGHPAGPWVLRAALAALFVTSVANLASKTSELI
ncbi:MAG: hypothetical protein ABIO67_06305 [Mycobacteriales bacterium]